MSALKIPQLWLFAGPNGAGKSTFTQFPEWSRHIRHFLNADELTRELLRVQGLPSFAAAPTEVLHQVNLAAAKKVFAEVARLLDAGEAVAVETVLSTAKYRPVIEKLRRDGGIFNLIYVGLSSPELSRERVRARVLKGGHPVPEEKLPGRWQRSLENLPWFARQADHCFVYDNSDSDFSSKPAVVALTGGAPGRLQFVNRTANPPVTEVLLRSGLFVIEP
ncbi:MAG: hypothetical protein RLZZ350_2684 [Verrucomicrobiota bacterium]